MNIYLVIDKSSVKIKLYKHVCDKANEAKIDRKMMR